MATKYYNTTNVSGSQLEDYEQKATAQEIELLALFLAHKTLSPSEIMELKPNMLRGSLSRALSNMTEENILIKTDKKKISKHGRPEHIWMLAGQPKQLNLF